MQPRSGHKSRFLQTCTLCLFERNAMFRTAYPKTTTKELLWHRTVPHLKQLNPECGSLIKDSTCKQSLWWSRHSPNDCGPFLPEPSPTRDESTWLATRSWSLRTLGNGPVRQSGFLATHCTFLRLEHAGFHHSSKTAECFAFFRCWLLQ